MQNSINVEGTESQNPQVPDSLSYNIILLIICQRRQRTQCLLFNQFPDFKKYAYYLGNNTVLVMFEREIQARPDE